MNVRTFALGVSIAASISGAASGQVGACWADITLDNAVNVSDLLQVITTWGPCQAAPPTPPPPGGGPNGSGIDDGGGEPPPPEPPTPAFCPADIFPIADPDGQINVGDLLLVITTWGQCAAPPPGQQGQGYVVWCEDWSNANYSRWTSAYNNDTNPCTVAGFDSINFQTPAMSMKSQVTCAGGVNGVHRGYGGLRFLGEGVLPNFATPSTGGIMSQYGMIIQFRNYLSVPYLFNAQDHDLWMSMLTVTDDCSNAWHRVLTLNIDNTSMRLRPSHVTGVQYVLGAPAFPRDVWNRVTVYLNIGAGTMHVWQNGVKVCHAWFTRPSFQACQFHFGLYCSGANSDITYFEDDFRIIKLTEPLTNLIGEPQVQGMASSCMPAP